MCSVSTVLLSAQHELAGGAGPRPSCMARVRPWASPSSTALAHWAASAVRSLPGECIGCREAGTHTFSLLFPGVLASSVSTMPVSVSTMPVSGYWV